MLVLCSYIHRRSDDCAAIQGKREKGEGFGRANEKELGLQINLR